MVRNIWVTHPQRLRRILDERTLDTRKGGGARVSDNHGWKKGKIEWVEANEVSNFIAIRFATFLPKA